MRETNRLQKKWWVLGWLCACCWGLPSSVWAGIPVANAGTDLPGVLQQPIALRGRGYDTEGLPIVSYQWTQQSGPPVQIQNADQATATVVLQQQAEYVFFFTVSNGSQVSQPDILAIRFLSQPNQHPKVQVNYNRLCVMSGQRVFLDGSSSRDPDGDALIYEWRQLAGPTLSFPDNRQNTLTFVPTEPGLYLLKFTVSDTKLSDAPAHIEVYVGDLKPCATEPQPERQEEFAQEFAQEPDREHAAGIESGEEPGSAAKDGGTSYDWGNHGGLSIEAKGCQCSSREIPILSLPFVLWFLWLGWLALLRQTFS